MPKNTIRTLSASSWGGDILDSKGYTPIGFWWDCSISGSTRRTPSGIDWTHMAYMEDHNDMIPHWGNLKSKV